MHVPRIPAAIILTSAILFFATSVVNAATANLSLTHLGYNLNTSSGWKHDIDAKNGEFVQLYAEAQTQDGADQAENVTVTIELPSQFANSTQTKATVSSSTSGVNSRTDIVNINFGGSQCRLVYVPGSTSVRLDRNRDGTAEHDGLWTSDSIGSGINFGTFSGGKGGVVQLTTKNRVECSGMTGISSTTVSGQGITINNSNSQSQSQSINFNGRSTTTSIPSVTKQPETGVGFAGILSLLGVISVGLVLSRFGRNSKALYTSEAINQTVLGLVNKRKKNI